MVVGYFQAVGEAVKLFIVIPGLSKYGTILGIIDVYISEQMFHSIKIHQLCVSHPHPWLSGLDCWNNQKGSKLFR